MIRSRSTAQAQALGLIACLLAQLVLPPLARAQTSGPSQPEVSGFEPVGTSEMVDLFTGDFVYNIPLIDAGGYAVNLSYHSGITMDQEASWVGLGWSVNPGVINRGVRGFADDFAGDEIVKEFNLRPNQTYGANLDIGNIEIFGKSTEADKKTESKFLGRNFGFGVFYNNYRGLGYEFSLNPQIATGDKNKFQGSAGLGLTANSQQGLDVSPSVGMPFEVKKKNETETSLFNLNLGAPMNARSGLKALTFSGSYSWSKEKNVQRRQAKDQASSGRKVSSFSMNGSVAIPMSPQSYVPQIQMPMQNRSGTVHAGLGLEAQWVDFKGKLTGYFTEQSLIDRRQEVPAYGYLYLDRGQDLSVALLDFNREKDGAFTKETPGLPLTQLTYDSYTVQGQGIGGMYRPFRSDVGTVFDSYAYNTSVSGQLGADVSSGNLVKVGVNAGASFNYSDSGRWSGLLAGLFPGAGQISTPLSVKRFSSGTGEIEDALSFKSLRPQDRLFEPYYFKQAGEMVAVDEDFHAALGGDQPVRLEVGKNGVAHARFRRPGEGLPIDAPMVKPKREPRHQAISALTAEQAAHAGVIRDIESYRTLDDVERISRLDYPGHHLSEITALRPDGARYVFGIPAYNLEQKDVTFNAADKDGDTPQPLAKSCATGLVTYQPGDNSAAGNRRGDDHYYSSTRLPPFAHSYLLTAILSPDYVDHNRNGRVDDGDLGSYTKLNYTRVHGGPLASESAGYRWRVPYPHRSANFNEGLKADPGDDKGSYVYGRKEIWYLHSIETRTHLAEFSRSGRLDSFGVGGEDGGLDPAMALQKLDKITLYAKWDRQTHGDNAVPIKTVHFRYDYSLTPDVPSNRNTAVNPQVPDTGKLTLREVFFTYGKSRKGELSGYRFHYSEHNPPYDLKGYDRWGNYKPNPWRDRPDAADCDASKGPLTNADVPYVEQDKVAADRNAAAWSLKAIELPSGGRIDVEYEADDYAFVQDRRAMQMVAVDAVGRDPNSFVEGGSGQLFGQGILDQAPNAYLRLRLPTPVNDREDFRRRYLLDADGEPIRELYFKFFVDVTGKSDWELVTGWAELDPETPYGRIDDTTAWIKLKAVAVQDGGDSGAHPIAKTAWQMARLHLSQVLNPGSEPESEDESALRGLLSAVGDVRKLVQGYNRVLRDQGAGKRVQLFDPDSGRAKSFVRLYQPSRAKLGGGARVLQVTLRDNWQEMLVEGADDPLELADSERHQSAEYGQRYVYTTRTDPDDPASPTISSGVATSEPIPGGEESPLRQPVFFTEKHKLAPDNRFFQEEPYGEILYPSPSVGYSRVEVRSIGTGGQRTATGHVVHEFYTAREFPTVSRQIGPDVHAPKLRWLLRLLKMNVRDHMTASQGYQVELNNMHGVQKAQWVYPEAAPGVDQVPISGVEYCYKTGAPDPEDKALLKRELRPFEAELESKSWNPRRLDNRVVVMDKDGSLRVSEIGEEIDLAVDMRQSASLSAGLEMAFNLDTSVVAGLPLPIPSGWPKVSVEETRFRSAVTTKVVTRYGVLHRVIAHDLGSRVSTENLVWDAETGEVLLTRTANDFQDPVYSFTYPAHWGYERMGAASKNLGLVLPGVEIADAGEAVTASASSFVPGDELLVLGGDDPELAWVSEVDSTAGRITLIDDQGRPAEPVSGATLNLFRSGRRNQPSTPIGTVTTLENPITADRTLAFDQILNAGAVEFTEDWDGLCECGLVTRSFSDGVGPQTRRLNPYLQGILGTWRAEKSHLYLTGRTRSDLNRNTDIRRDGVFDDFSPFWLPNGGRDWIKNDAGWQFTSAVDLFSPFGFELQNVDALDRYSAAIYGFNNTLPTAVASNSQYREIAFESFEDVACDACETDHFSLTTRLSDLSREQSHTGRFSLRVAPRSKVSAFRKLECDTELTPLVVDARIGLEFGCDRLGGVASRIQVTIAGGRPPYRVEIQKTDDDSFSRDECLSSDGDCEFGGVFPGTYEISVTDGAGTPETAEVTMPEIVRVTVERGENCESCGEGAQCDLTALAESLNEGPLTYRWQNWPSGGPNPIDVGEAMVTVPRGCYSILVTDALGCRQTLYENFCAPHLDDNCEEIEDVLFD